MHDIQEFLTTPSIATVLPVVETISADLLTPLAVYLKLASGETRSFLLESVEGGESLGRFSFIGVRPEFTLTGNDRSVSISDAGGTTNLSVSTIDFLRRHFSENRLTPDPGLPSFAGGAIGTMNFSCARWFEPSLETSLSGSEDEAAFLFCRTVVAFDHAKQLISIISLVYSQDAEGNDEQLRDLIENAKATNASIRRRLETAPVELPDEHAPMKDASVTSNLSRKEFTDAVGEIKSAIFAGDAYQVVLSQRFTRRTAASPVAIYRAMRSINPSPYMFLINFGDRSVIGSSPEMLVRASGPSLEYRPIAGTRPRGLTPDEDDSFSEEMRADAKEVAEHMMLVDLGRNDLGRVADFGTVSASDVMSVEKYSHVQHLVTRLTAKLSKGRDRFDALAACFPAGTVSGAPKVNAIKMICRLEPTPRGLYSGAVGYFDYAGNMDTCIAIRTMVVENGIAHIQAGAGIVADSDPDSEYRETINKASALIRAIEAAEQR